MAQGKRNIDPNLIADFDLMTLRPEIEKILAGMPSPISIVLLARFREGLIHQYIENIPKARRAEIKVSAQRTIEHAIGNYCQCAGERAAIERLLHFGEISQASFDKYAAELETIIADYCMVAAKLIIDTMDVITRYQNKNGKGAGRPKGSRRFLPIDGEVLREVGKRLATERGDDGDWTIELRQVLREYRGKGLLPERGETAQDSINIHVQRIAGFSKKTKT